MSPTDRQVDVSNKTGPSSGEAGRKMAEVRKFVKGEGDRTGPRWMVQGWPVTRQVI